MIEQTKNLTVNTTSMSEAEVTESSLVGHKKLVFFGDSIMANRESSFGELSSGTSVPAYVRQLLDADVYNFGIGGTCMTYVTDDIIEGCVIVEEAAAGLKRSSQLSMEKLAEFITSDEKSGKEQSFAALGQTALYESLCSFNFSTEEPVFCIAYGTNDCSWIRYTEGLLTLEGFKTATRNVVNQLQSSYPGCKIVLISPIWRGGNDPVGSNVWDSTILGPAGNIKTRLTNVVSAMEEVAEELDVYFCNDYHLTNWETKEIFYAGEGADYVHPNEEGSYRMAQHIAAFLKQTLGYKSRSLYTFSMIGRYNGKILYTNSYKVTAGSPIGSVFTAAEANTLSTYTKQGVKYISPVYRDTSGGSLSLAQLQTEECTDDTAKWYIDYQAIGESISYHTVQFMDTLDGAYTLIQEFKNVPYGTIMQSYRTEGNQYYVADPTRAGGYTYYNWQKAYPSVGGSPDEEEITSDTVFAVVWSKDGSNRAGEVTELYNASKSFCFHIIGRYNGDILYDREYNVSAGESVGSVFTAAEANSLSTYTPLQGNKYINPVYKDINGNTLSLTQLQSEVCIDDTAKWYIDYQATESSSYYTVQFMDTLDGAYTLFKDFKNVPWGTTLDYLNSSSRYYVPAPTRAGGYTFYGWQKAYPTSGFDPQYEKITSDTVFAVIWTNKDGSVNAGEVTGLYHIPENYTFQIRGRYNGTTLYTKSYTIQEDQTVGTAFTETEAGNLQTYTSESGLIYKSPVYRDGSGNTLTLSQLQAKMCTNNTSVWYVDYQVEEEPSSNKVYISKLEVRTIAINPWEDYVWGRTRINVADYKTITLGNASVENSDGTFSAPRTPSYYTTDTFPAVVVKGVSGTTTTTLGTGFNKAYNISNYSVIEVELRIFAKDWNGGTITLKDIELEKNTQTNTLTVPYMSSETTDYNTNVYTRTMQTIVVNTADFSTLSIGTMYFERCYRQALGEIDYPYLKITGTKNGANTVIRNSAGSGLMPDAYTGPITLNTTASYNIAAYDSVTVEIATNTQEGASVVQLNNIVFSK